MDRNLDYTLLYRVAKAYFKDKKTQQEIANYLQTGQSYYAKYENGHRPLPLDRLKMLCEYYHVSADYILGLPDDLPYGTSKTREK